MSDVRPIAAAVLLSGAAIMMIYLSSTGGDSGGAQADVQPVGTPTAPTPTISTVSASLGVQQMAQAIAFAEGYFDENENVASSSTIPVAANNPGDLVIPGWTGAQLGEGISVFASITDGWNRLYNELNLIASGNSSVYSTGMSFYQMGAKWAPSDPTDWSNNVVSFLNQNFGYQLDPNGDTIGEVIS